MILTCNNCSTSFRLDRHLLNASGSKVRCSRCKHIWRAYPSEAEASETERRMDSQTPPDHAAVAAAGLAAGAALTASPGAGDQTALEDTPPQPNTAVEAGPPELKLGFDEAPAPEPEQGAADNDLVADEVNLDELDLLLTDDPVPSGPATEDDFKTEELNLADLEKMLESEADEPPAAAPLPAAPVAEDLDTDQAETDESIIEELDLDMDNLENLLEQDADLGGGVETPTVAETPGEEIKLDLATELDDLLADDSQDPGVEETEEIGLPELDEGPEGEDIAPVSNALADDDDMNLELAPGLDSLFDDIEDKDVPLEETEDLDLTSLEDGLGLRNQATDADSDNVVAADPIQPDEDDELEMTLSLDDEGDLPDTPVEDGGETLDLGNLEDALADSGDDPSKLSPGEEQPELVLELDGSTDESADLDNMNLALDDLAMDPADQVQDSDIEETRELDLEDLESLLNDDEAPAAETSAPEVEDLELDFDLDEAPADDDGPTDDATRELNLDDIEKILESQDAGAAAVPTEAGADADAELDLDLDLGHGAEDGAASDEPAMEKDETGADGNSLDLTELEKMLDVEDTTDSPALPAEEDIGDLDLEFDLQPATEEGDELELEFDMLEDDSKESSALFDTSESEDLGLELDAGTTPEPEKADREDNLDREILGKEEGEDLDLDILEEESEDFDLDIVEEQGDDLDLDLLGEADTPETKTTPIEAAAGVAGAAASRDLTQELMDEMAAADTQTMEIPPADSKPVKPAPVAKKRKSNKALVLLLLLVMLGAAVFFVYTKTGFDPAKFNLANLPEIPFVSQWLGGQKAPEAVVPVETTLKGSWVQNQSDGRLYIIQGRVKNEYSQPRSFIRVTGRIYADGRQFTRAAQAYCGNMPSQQDLENKPAAELQKILGNRNGTDNVNVNVAPGNEVPFTVVFAGLPDDVELQEYAVEISGSLPATGAKTN